MRQLTIILTTILLISLTACGQTKVKQSDYIINPENVDSVELIQVDHPYIGDRVASKKLDHKLVLDFLSDFENKNEAVYKFHSCYVIKIHLKNGQLISYRTNGQLFEKFKDDNTKAIYFKLNKDINLVTKYWGISKENFCDTNTPDRIANIPKDAFWVGGADGGQWYLADKIDSTNQTIHFKIYNDYTGDVVVDKVFKL